MKNELCLLMLEDNELDADLIKRLLQRSGMAFTAVLATGKKEFIAAITDKTFDAVLADNSLPQFNSIEALKILQERGIEMPFILVTGTVSEEFAAEIIRLGADDYILKNNLSRLPSAINRAIELHQMQREQKRAEEELKASNERFNLISKATNDALWEWDMHTDKMWWSESHYAMFGYEPGKTTPGLEAWLQKIHPDDRRLLTDTLERIKRKELNNWENELRFIKPDYTWGTLLQRGFALPDKDGYPVRLMGSFLDITARKQAEEALQRSESKYKLLFEQNPMPMWMVALPGLQIVDVNESAIEHYGYSRKEFLHMTSVDLRPEEDREKFINYKAPKTNGTRFAGIWRHRKKDGTIINVDVIAHDIIYNGQPVRLVLSNDITTKLQAEENLKQSHEEMRQLASRLQEIREEERASMAREIHDELGQQLTGLKMDVSWLSKKLVPREEHIDSKLKSITELLNETIVKVRKLATELRPSILDDVGLAEAMEWQSAEFEKRSGIKVNFSSEGPPIAVPVNISIGLFRIYQESLTNVARHAEASEVKSSLVLQGHELALSITDNGKGFDPGTIGHKKTLGLLGMKERTVMMGGSYTIKSRPGQGTTVSINVPV